MKQENTHERNAGRGEKEAMAQGGSHPLLREAAHRYCTAHGLECSELSHGWVLRIGRGEQARFFHGFDLGLNAQLAAKAADDKAFCALRFAEAGVPHVPRRLVMSPALFMGLRGTARGWAEEARAAVAEMAAAGEGGAVVVKPNRGRGGADVWLCRTKDAALRRLAAVAARWPDGAACVEPWLPAARECRFVVLDGEVLLAFAKVAGNAGEGGKPKPRLHNLGRDGRIAPLQASEEELAGLARRAAQALGLRFCTVDILSRGDEEPLVLEANANVTLARAAEALGVEKVLRVYEKAIARALEGR